MDSVLNFKLIEGIQIELNKLREAYETLVSKVNSQSAKPFYTNKEIKEIFDINDGTLATWRAEGILKGKKLRGTWVYKAEDVLKIAD